MTCSLTIFIKLMAGAVEEIIPDEMEVRKLLEAEGRLLLTI
jgi:hypothetical protein